MIERQYRSRVQPGFRSDVTVDVPARRPQFQESIRVNETTVDPPSAFRPGPRSDVKVTEETVEFPQRYDPNAQNSRMGYYDEDGKAPYIPHLSG